MVPYHAPEKDEGATDFQSRQCTQHKSRPVARKWYYCRSAEVLIMLTLHLSGTMTSTLPMAAVSYT